MPRLPYGDRLLIDDLSKAVWDFVWLRLDDEGDFSADIAGRVAQAASQAARDALTRELKVEDD